MIFAAYLKQVVPNGKTALLMKSVVSIFIIVSIFNGIKTFNFKSFFDPSESDNKNSTLISEAVLKTEQELKREFQGYIDDYGFKAVIKSVKTEGDVERLQITKIVVCGADAEEAGRLIAGRYHIEESIIEVINE